MPELPDAQRVPQPSPRLRANVRQQNAAGLGSSEGHIRDPPIRPTRGATPATVFVSGASRPVVNSVAFALAEIIDLTPFWLEIRSSDKPREGPDPGSTGWIPPDRLFVSEGGRGLEPNSLVAGSGLWAIVRSDEPASILSHLTDFLRLPDVVQEILSATPSGGGPKALVVANSDQVAHLFPRTADGLQRLLGTMAPTALNIIAAHTGRTGPGRFGFATVFRLDVESPTKWMEGTIVCEQGIHQGAFAVGRANRLSDIPGIARVFTGLFPAES
jgi:hypothetical protein